MILRRAALATTAGPPHLPHTRAGWERSIARQHLKHPSVIIALVTLRDTQFRCQRTTAVPATIHMPATLACARVLTGAMTPFGKPISHSGRRIFTSSSVAAVIE